MFVKAITVSDLKNTIFKELANYEDNTLIAVFTILVRKVLEECYIQKDEKAKHTPNVTLQGKTVRMYFHTNENYIGTEYFSYVNIMHDEESFAISFFNDFWGKVSQHNWEIARNEITSLTVKKGVVIEELEKFYAQATIVQQNGQEKSGVASC